MNSSEWCNFIERSETPPSKYVLKNLGISVLPIVYSDGCFSSGTLMVSVESSSKKSQANLSHQEISSVGPMIELGKRLYGPLGLGLL